MFEKAIRLILKWEAGYVNDPKDPGGETKFGISKRSYPNVNIAKLTESEAIAIYRRDYWDACQCDKLPYSIALIVFDTAVNMGTSTAIRFLQSGVHVKEDGIIGPVTIARVSAMEEIALVASYSTLRMQRYISLPTFPIYGFGWTRRLFDITIQAFRR